MKIKRFTLIELLAVMLIFGILASIGLSITKPSQVKNEVSSVVGLMQRARAHAIENRCTTYVKFDTTTHQAQVLFQNPFTNEWKQQVASSSKDLGQGVTLKAFEQSGTGSSATYSVSSKDAFGVMFDKNGLIVKQSELDTASGVDFIGDSVAIYDPSNKKNIFTVRVYKMGSYDIYSGQDEIPSSYSLSGL